jgi:hypothetical protein
MRDERMDVNDQLQIMLKEAVILGEEGALCNSAICLWFCELARTTASSETGVSVPLTARGQALSLLRPLFF